MILWNSMVLVNSWFVCLFVFPIVFFRGPCLKNLKDKNENNLKSSMKTQFNTVTAGTTANTHVISPPL